MCNIYLNTIIEWCDEDNNLLSLERVLWISPQIDEVVLIRIDNGNSLPFVRDYGEIIDALKTPYIKKLKKDPYNYFLDLEQDFIEKHKEKRDRAWEIIKDLVELEPKIYSNLERGELIKECIKKHGVTSKYIYKKLKQYWVGGKTKNALFPLYKNSGGSGRSKNLKDKKVGRPPKKSEKSPELIGVNVTEEDKKIFKTAIKSFYEKSEAPELKFTYDEMIKNYYHEGYHITQNGIEAPVLPNAEDVPTYRQFRYWYNKEYNIKERFLHREGERKFNLSIKPNVGEAAKRAVGPGAIYEIDATVADVYLVSSLARNRIIGRPIVYIVKDVFSRLVVGVYVGLEGPSWLSAMLALENTSMNKKEYCKSLNINIEEYEWPAQNMPNMILADRGELEGYNADRLTDSLGITVLNAPPYRADLKGIVEQHFRTINTKIKKWVPGAVHKDYQERGGKDYRLDAKLTLKALERIIVLSILEHNQKIISNYPLTADMIEKGVIPTPINLWEWGIKNRQGSLKEYDREIIRLALMPTKEASITRDGVYFNKRYYSSEYAISQAWFEESVLKKRKKINVSYDPRSINYIYIRNGQGKLILLNMLNKLDSDGDIETRDEDYLEYHYARSIEEELIRNEKRQFSSDIDTHIETIIAEESIKTNKAKMSGESKSSQKKAIKDNRKEEKEYMRKNENWDDTLVEKNQVGQADVLNFKQQINEEPFQPDGTGAMLGMLKQQSEKRRSTK